MQKQGYINAFKDASTHSLISSLSGGIAVSYAEWASGQQQILRVGWTHLTDANSANGFADAMFSTTRAYNGMTAPGSAINWGAGLFGDEFVGSRSIIDISGDGIQNSGDNTFNAALAAYNAGIIVNGLAIGGTSLANWYQDNIVTPGGGFLVVASSFDDFSDAIYTKLLREIQPVPVPEPATILLFGFSLMGLLVSKRKFIKK